MSAFSYMMAQRSFKSLYSLVVSYDLITAWNEVNSLGEFFTNDVKMNSYLLYWNLVRRYSASVDPRKAEFVSLISVFRILSKPTLKFTFWSASENQTSRRLVIRRLPRSPLFPLVSSTEWIESMTFSPLRTCS